MGCSKNVYHFSKDVNMPKKFVKFHHFSDLENHVALRAILRPEYEGYIRNTIYRCKKDGQTQIFANRFRGFSIFVKNEIIRKQPVLNRDFLSNQASWEFKSGVFGKQKIDLNN